MILILESVRMIDGWLVDDNWIRWFSKWLIKVLKLEDGGRYKDEKSKLEWFQGMLMVMDSNDLSMNVDRFGMR